MRTRFTMRAALAFGLPAVARNIGRARRWSRGLLKQAGHEAGRGNVVTAAGLLIFWMVGV